MLWKSRHAERTQDVKLKETGPVSVVLVAGELKKSFPHWRILTLGSKQCPTTERRAMYRENPSLVKSSWACSKQKMEQEHPERALIIP